MKNIFLAGFACVAFLLGAGPSWSATARPDLTGQVVGNGGAPLAKATVFIYTAGPKEGTSTLCPSCYPDCLKKAMTDKEGRFKFESLDGSLLFRLLVVANGHESRFVTKVDPAKGEQKINMTALSESALKSTRRIRGAVISDKGEPVPNAVISPEGVGMGDMTRWGGNDEVIEPLAVADEAGHFVLFCKSNNVDTVYAVAEGAGVAKQWVTLKPGGDYLVKLPEGVSLTGRVMHDGKPMKGVTIAANTKERTCGVYFDVDGVTTDDEGRFMLLNVPPNRQFLIYATMSSMGGTGTLPERLLTTGDSGTKQDLGQMSVQPGYTIAGKIVLADGKAIPANTRLFLGLEGAMDTQETKLDADGQFEFKGVPASSLSISLRIAGYKLSGRNPSLDRLNGRILGRIGGDVKELTILMEPGSWKPNDEEGRMGGDDDFPVDKPLRGVKL